MFPVHSDHSGMDLQFVPEASAGYRSGVWRARDFDFHELTIVQMPSARDVDSSQRTLYLDCQSLKGQEGLARNGTGQLASSRSRGTLWPYALHQQADS